MSHWRNLNLWSETVQTVSEEKITILWLRVDMKIWKYHFLKFFSFTMATRLCFLHSIVRPLANVHFHKDDPRCYVYSVMSNMIMKCSYDVYHQLGPRLKKLIFFRGPPEFIQCHFSCHLSSLTIFGYIVGDRADRCWRGIHMFRNMSWFSINHSSL